VPDRPTVDAYIAALPDGHRQVATRLRELVAEVAPGASVSIKWGQPVWETNGPFAYLKPFAFGINFGFWRGADLYDPDDLLAGDGFRMRHLRVVPGDPLPEDAIRGWVAQAVELNKARGDPTKARGDPTKARGDPTKARGDPTKAR
jgi:hypothetical protein